MDTLKDPPVVRKFFKKSIVSISRLISVYKIFSLIFTAIVFGALFLYLIEDKDIEAKLGTLANIVIAIAVCWITYSSYSKSANEKRENELAEKCDGIVGVIKSHSVHGDKETTILNHFGKDGSVIDAYRGRRYFSQWVFMHQKSPEYCIFHVRVQRISKDASYAISDSCETITYTASSSGRGISTTRNTKPDEFLNADADTSIKLDEISGNDWEALMQAITNIAKGMSPEIKD